MKKIEGLKIVEDYANQSNLPTKIVKNIVETYYRQAGLSLNGLEEEVVGIPRIGYWKFNWYRAKKDYEHLTKTKLEDDLDKAVKSEDAKMIRIFQRLIKRRNLLYDVLKEHDKI